MAHPATASRVGVVAFSFGGVMRLGLLLSLTLVSSCLGDCSSIGVGKMRGGGMRHGGMVGSMRSPVGGVVGIDWPGTPAILWEAGKETDYADGDPVTTPTNFGSLTINNPTQSTGTAKGTYQDPCDVGPGIPCFYLDGGDYWRASAAEAAVAFLHDGTGMACYGVVEVVAGSTAGPMLDTGGWTSTEIGTMLYWSGAATQRQALYVHRGVSAQSVITGNPTGGTFGTTRTAAFAVSHGSSRSTQHEELWRGGSTAPTGGSGAYAFSPPSSSNATWPLTIGERANLSLPVTFYLFALACYDADATSAEMGAVLDAIETVTGALPQ